MSDTVPGKFLWIPLLAAALAMEAEAAYAFLRPATGPGLMPALLLLHGLACLLLAVVATRHPPRQGPGPGWTAFVFCFAFFLPGLGMAGLLLAVLPALMRPAPAVERAYGSLGLEPGDASGEDGHFRYGPGGIRARLLSRRIPAAGRLQFLMALRNQATPQGNRLMRELLRDPADELRLMAYGTLERREMDLQEAMGGARAALRRNPEDASALRRLAFLHWEMAYQELAEGDLSEHYLRQALGFAERALQSHPEDGSLWILTGQVQARLGDWDLARRALDAAERLGAPAQRIIPRLAELAFLRRDFRETRRLLAQAPQLRVPALEPLLRFWTGTV